MGLRLPPGLWDSVLSLWLAVIVAMALQCDSSRLLHCECICKALWVRKLLVAVSAPSGAPIPAVLPKSVLKPFKLAILYCLLRQRNKLNLQIPS